MELIVWTGALVAVLALVWDHVRRRATSSETTTTMSQRDRATETTTTIKTVGGHRVAGTVSAAATVILALVSIISVRQLSRQNEQISKTSGQQVTALKSMAAAAQGQFEALLAGLPADLLVAGTDTKVEVGDGKQVAMGLKVENVGPGLARRVEVEFRFLTRLTNGSDYPRPKIVSGRERLDPDTSEAVAFDPGWLFQLRQAGRARTTMPLLQLADAASVPPEFETALVVTVLVGWTDALGPRVEGAVLLWTESSTCTKLVLDAEVTPKILSRWGGRAGMHERLLDWIGRSDGLMKVTEHICVFDIPESPATGTPTPIASMSPSTVTTSLTPAADVSPSPSPRPG